MTLPPLTYLTFDSLEEGVGASQVLPYAERLSRRGIDVTLHSFEKGPEAPRLRQRIAAAGIRWRPHRFRGGGSMGGLARILHGAGVIRGTRLVHARSDLAAASAMVAGVPSWIWDVRSFWADQRIALGTLRRRSPQERLLRRIERAAALRSTGIVTLTEAALETLAGRFGDPIARKAVVVPTCVELDRCELQPLPKGEVVRLLFSGTLNAFYDLPAMLRFAARMRLRRPTEMRAVVPGQTAWDRELAEAGVSVDMASPADVFPHLAASHVGLSVCRSDAGISLRAALPTKIGEFLACGRPVVVNAGLGDMDDLLARFHCGVSLAGTSDNELDRASAAVDDLLRDPATPERCRALAEEHFDIERGVDTLVTLYQRAVS